MITNYNNTAVPQRIPPDSSDFTWYLEAIRGFSYVAAMTRRCPNWIESRLQRYPEHRPAFAGLLTENGLLMQAEEIAECYRDTGHFPRIALLDDLLVHGRSLNRFLQTLLELLAACLKADPNTLLEDLCRSLTVFVFVANDAPVLLRQEYQWRMRFEDVAQENKWRGISEHISQAIFHSEVANTSYVVSAIVPHSAAFPAPGGWELVDERAVSYRHIHQQLYVHALSGTRKAYPTVRSYLRGGVRYYTPYFFCGTLKEAQIDRLLSMIRTRLEAEALTSYLRFLLFAYRANAYPQRKAVFFQLVNLLLGQITLKSFLADAGQPLGGFQLDTEKISRNFGSSPAVKSWLDDLCTISWPEDMLLQVCDALEIPSQTFQISHQPVFAGQIRFSMMVVVQLLAVRHEAYAKSLEQSFAAGRGTTDIKLTGEANFEPFLSLVFSILPSSAWEHDTVLLILSCLTQMMDVGDICLKARVRLDQDSGQYLYDSSVRNTEMSLSILPRNLGPYFPAFVRAAQLYQREDDFPDLAVAYLERLLPKSLPGTGEIFSTAQVLAQMVANYRGMSDTLLDWENVLPESETSA